MLVDAFLLLLNYWRWRKPLQPTEFDLKNRSEKTCKHNRPHTRDLHPRLRIIYHYLLAVFSAVQPTLPINSEALLPFQQVIAVL